MTFELSQDAPYTSDTAQPIMVQSTFWTIPYNYKYGYSNESLRQDSNTAVLGRFYFMPDLYSFRFQFGVHDD